MKWNDWNIVVGGGEMLIGGAMVIGGVFAAVFTSPLDPVSYPMIYFGQVFFKQGMDTVKIQIYDPTWV
jgi:hypothetical protein